MAFQREVFTNDKRFSRREAKIYEGVDSPLNAHTLLASGARIIILHRWGRLDPVVLTVTQQNAHEVGERGAWTEVEKGAPLFPQVSDLLHSESLQATFGHMAYARNLHKETTDIRAGYECNIKTSAILYSYWAN